AHHPILRSATCFGAHTRLAIAARPEVVRQSIERCLTRKVPELALRPSRCTSRREVDDGCVSARYAGDEGNSARLLPPLPSNESRFAPSLPPGELIPARGRSALSQCITSD